MKNVIFALLLTGLFACNGSGPELKNAEKMVDRSEQKIVTGGTASNDLRANAIREDDVQGRIKWSLGLLQEELRKSAGKVAELGEVDVLLDENLTLVIRNKVGKDVLEERIGLANLNPDPKSFEIVVDNKKNPHPGIKLAVLSGKPGVGIYKNGSKQNDAQQLELFFAERDQVSRVASAMVQAINVAQGKL
ncbi:MAG TPA: hypothetical protein ENJ95_08525 [Bacteroidetes bacterium]|nr:hypothetical protein [Bacteroidota bacterium]